MRGEAGYWILVIGYLIPGTGDHGNALPCLGYKILSRSDYFGNFYLCKLQAVN